MVEVTFFTELAVLAEVAPVFWVTLLEAVILLALSLICFSVSGWTLLIGFDDNGTLGLVGAVVLGFSFRGTAGAGFGAALAVANGCNHKTMFDKTMTQNQCHINKFY